MAENHAAWCESKLSRASYNLAAALFALLIPDITTYFLSFEQFVFVDQIKSHWIRHPSMSDLLYQSSLSDSGST
jgi:hypothetical protein